MPAKYIKNKLDKWWSRVLFRLISKSTHATRITLKLQPAEKSIKAWREWSRIMLVMVSRCSKGGSDECLASCLILLPCSRQPTCLNVRKHYSWERRKTSCVVRMKKQTNILTKEIKIFETQKRHGQKVAKKMKGTGFQLDFLAALLSWIYIPWNWH